MRILSLDLGSATGWAFSPGPGRTIESGTFTIATARGESPGMRYVRWNAWIDEMIRKTAPDLVTYEMPHLRGGAAATLLAGLATRVEEACARCGRPIEHTQFHSATMKKWATGSGSAKKDAMIRAAEKFAGRAFDDDNEADAWLQLAFAQWSLEPGQPDVRVKK